MSVHEAMRERMVNGVQTTRPEAIPDRWDYRGYTIQLQGGLYLIFSAHTAYGGKASLACAMDRIDEIVEQTETQPITVDATVRTQVELGGES